MANKKEITNQRVKTAPYENDEEHYNFLLERSQIVFEKVKKDFEGLCAPDAIYILTLFIFSLYELSVTNDSLRYKVLSDF